MGAYMQWNKVYYARVVSYACKMLMKLTSSGSTYPGYILENFVLGTFV
jgi:hypothetical protein